MRCLGLFLVAILELVFVAGCGSPGVDSEPADLVLRGGRVVTVAETPAEAQAVAIRGAWIVQVGTDEEVAPLVGPETEVIELEGRLAIPGFIEGHGHFMSLGDARSILDLTTASSWEGIVAQVAEAADGAGPGEWIRGRGWHQEKWDRSPDPSVEGSPVHNSLSAASPDNPVILRHASGHASFVNATALELAGIDRDTADPPGGEIVRDPAGEATGLLRETAQRLVGSVMAEAREGRSEEEVDAERRRLVELAGAEALAKGVTSFHDAGVSFEILEFFQRLEAEGALPIRLYAMVRGQSNDEMEARLAEFRSEADGDDYLAIRSIKRQIDGALGAHGAWLLEPYEDLPESVGLVLEPEEEIRRTAEIAVANGFQVNTHAIGDRANRVMLDIYGEAFAAAGEGGDLRWRIEHAQHLDPDDIGRFAELGVIASMQGVHCTSDGPWVHKRIGLQRAEEGAYVWRSLIESGALITNGTDVPVEDIDPIASFYSTVTRMTKSGKAFFPDQRMTRMEALQSYTINNAYASFEEGIKGSLEVGKLADIVILDRDILTVSDEEIPTARVDTTILGGVVRYQRGE